MTIDYNDQMIVLRTSVNSSGIESDSRTFVFGNYIDEVLIMRQPTGTEYLYGHDHLYSPAVLFDAAGTAVRRYEYDVYGRMRPYSAAWGAVPWPAWQILGNYYAFTGRELDRVGTSQTGFLEIMYYRARYYDPDTGRFLQPDPLGLDPAGGRINPFAPTSQYADGMNRYEYAKNNSCRYLDPLGLLPPPSPISPYPPLPVPYPPYLPPVHREASENVCSGSFFRKTNCTPWENYSAVRERQHYEYGCTNMDLIGSIGPILEIVGGPVCAAVSIIGEVVKTPVLVCNQPMIAGYVRTDQLCKCVTLYSRKCKRECCQFRMRRTYYKTLRLAYTTFGTAVPVPYTTNKMKCLCEVPAGQTPDTIRKRIDDASDCSKLNE